MPRKRRKLSPELEKEISAAKRRIELITAIINDIEDEPIQLEYKIAFEPVRNMYVNLASLYTLYGVTDESKEALQNYKNLIEKFEGEYEI